MSMMKKLFYSTLAVVLVVSCLSLNGAAYASAATSPNFEELFTKVKAVHDELAADSQGLLAVKAADERAALVLANIKGNAAGLVEPVWRKLPEHSDYTYITEENVLKLISQFTLSYSEDGSNYYNILTNKGEVSWKTINDLAKLARFPHGADDLSFTDISAFYDEVFKVISENLLEISAIAVSDGSQAAKDELNTLITTEVIDPQVLKVSQLLKRLGLSMGDINAVKRELAVYDDHVTPIDPKGEAQKAMEGAFVRNILGTNAFHISNPSGTRADVWLQYGSLRIPNELLNWELEDSRSDVIITGETKNTFTVNSGFTRAAGVKIAAKAQGILLYSGTIDLIPSSSGGNPGGGGGAPGGGGGAAPGGGGAGGTPSSAGQIGADAQKAIKDLKDQLNNATPQQKQQIIQQAQSKAQEAIKQLAHVDLSSTVTVQGDRAIAKPDVAKLVEQLKEANKQIAALQAQLTELGADANTKVEFTMDFSAVNASTTQIPLSQELLKAMSDNGVDAMAVKVGDLTIAVDPQEFGADTTLDITRMDPAAATSVADLPLASNVYSLEFTSGGSAKTSFTTPVELRLPVSNANRLDTELLSLAKIVDGKMIFFGGDYDAATGTFSALRTGLSTYVVVENKVNFSDTSSVKSWAGRQIEVVAAKGIIEGRADGEYVPNAQVTRAEFASMLVKAFGVEDLSAAESFADVNNSDWFKAAVASAVKHGIINGRSDTEFDPNGSITRAEMATMAARALMNKGGYSKVPDADAALKAFADAADIHATLKEGVAFAASQGIVIGEYDNLFNPQGSASRAQAAVIIYRLINK